MINVQKWTDVIAKEEAELENLNAAETQARADIEKCQKELEELHEKRAVAKDKLRIVQNQSIESISRGEPVLFFQNCKNGITSL